MGRSPIGYELRLRARGLDRAPGDSTRQDVTVWAPLALTPPPGTPVIFTGRWRHHTRYGWQYQAHDYRLMEALSPRAQEVLWAVLGVRRSRDTPDATDKSLYAVAAATPTGSAPARALNAVLGYQYREQLWRRWPLTGEQRLELARQHGDQVLQVLHDDPYAVLAQFTEPDPNGWREQLHRAGLAPEGDEAAWLRGWAAYAIHEHVRETGSSRAAESRVLDMVGARAHQAPSRVREQLSHLPAASGIVRLDGGDGAQWALRHCLEAERRTAARLGEIVAAAPKPLALPKDWQASPELASVGQLTADQRRAAELLLSSPVGALIGGAGSGKTFTLRGTLAWARAADPGQRIRCAAPTGKAAARLMEVTGEEAVTIDRLLAASQGHGLDVDLLVVDEMSMPTLSHFDRLVHALPDGGRLVLVGDPNQLGPIGMGQPLQDLITSNRIPVAALTEPHRAALDSAIVSNAYRILAGQPPEEGEDYVILRSRESDESLRRYLARAVVPRALERVSSPSELQVVVPTVEGPLGAIALNRVLQPQLNPQFDPTRAVAHGPWHFGAGDRVLQLVNDYHRDVFNGESGRISSVDPGRGEVRVRFGARELSYRGRRLDQLALAYALTVHKAQGSEYETVLMLGSPAAQRLMSREWLMTAETRGRRLVIDMLHPDALHTALARPTARQRSTGLAEAVRQAIPAPPGPASVASRPASKNTPSGLGAAPSLA